MRTIWMSAIWTTCLETAIALLTVASVASAQVTTATVSGTVTDSSGGVLPGATVTLINASQGTRSAPVITNGTGDFVFPNVTASTYVLEVVIPGFKTLQRSGVSVDPGSRIALGALVLEVGGAEETVTVTGEAPLIQAASGERSFTVESAAVADLPLANRAFNALTGFTPGVTGTTRLGGGGANTTTIDGVAAGDTSGANAVLLQVSLESIQEVKVLTSGYQAEYGRTSGLQIAAVTKSGSNRFHGSLYDVEKNSAWNANSKTSILNGDPKAALSQRDFGYSIGGPIGKPGGSNKLFFFYSQEYSPRSQGGSVNRFRVPTALERVGDFSQTTDNNGNPFNTIKDPLMAGACSAANHAACFADGGVLGRIPAGRLYQPGLAILNLYPLPNIDSAGLNYNYQDTQPTEHALSMIPVVRVDYQPSAAARLSGKWSSFVQPSTTFRGTLPGLTESTMYKPSDQYTISGTLLYTLSSSTFFEMTAGTSHNLLTGCALGMGGNGTGPVFCTSGIPVGALSGLQSAGLDGLPTIYPYQPLRQDYLAYEALSAIQPPLFQNGFAEKTPNFTWNGRVANAPPNVPFPGFLNALSTRDVVASVTKLAGSHTLKAGVYYQWALKTQNGNGGAPFPTYNFQNNTNNPLDSGFPYANAALGIANAVTQSTAFVEGQYLYDDIEWYVQDSWKANTRLTLDYGLRFVHQGPIYDRLGQSSNFLPSQFDPTQAPTLYVAACANGAATCTGTARQARNPTSGALLGPGSAVAIGTIVPETGNALNGLFLEGQGIAKTSYTLPGLAYAPRLGGAYDVTGDQRVVIRGNLGLFYDIPAGAFAYSQVSNPPTTVTATVNFANLANSLSGTMAAPTLNAVDYHAKLQKSAQWSGGVQIALPWSSALDVSYVGQHAWDRLMGVNINAIDLGAAFLPQNQDTTQTATFLGSNTIPDNAMRSYLGYGAVTLQMNRAWETFHSIQISLQRRFSHGVSFGFNDTWSLSDQTNSAARLEHPSPGVWQYRADQAQADALLNQDPVAHAFKVNFVWDFPDLRGRSGPMGVVAQVANDWQLAGVWTASTGAPYVVGFSYQTGGTNANLTGSSDYAARVLVTGDPGAGCSSDPYRQFNTAAFAGPQAGSLGLDSGANYLRGCFQSQFDLSLSRRIKLGGTRSIQIRLDMFNAPNQAIITGRQTVMNLGSPAAPTTITNLPFDADGNVIATRSLPKNAGFGVANAYQVPRTLQAQIRFEF